LVIKDDIIINSSTTIATGATGSITFTFIGGTGPFNYTVNGQTTDGISYGPTTGTATGTPSIITNLSAGTYTISATDSLGTPVTATVVVSGQPPLFANVGKTKNATTTVSNDGEITISTVGGGIPPYNYSLYSFAGALISSGSLTTPKILNNLAVDNINGYKVQITDSSSSLKTFTGITINGPNPIVINGSSVNLTCYGSNNGSISTSVTGGYGVVTTNTTSTIGYTNSTTGSANLTGLAAGTYTLTASDISGGTATISFTLTQPPKLYILPYVLSEVQKQCDPTMYHVPFYVADTGVSAGSVPAGPFNYEYSLDGGAWIPKSTTYTNGTTPIILSFTSPSAPSVRIRFSSGGCTSNILTIPASAITLPNQPLVVNVSLTQVVQCTVGVAAIQVLLGRDPSRAPLTIHYSKNGGLTWLLAGTAPGTSYSFNIPVSTTQNVLVRATDNKGCTKISGSLTIVTPSAPLTCLKSTGALITTGVNAGKYPHTITGSGGFAPYTGTGTFYTTSPTYHTTITDSQGCQASV
jgi:hypothetical protein